MQQRAAQGAPPSLSLNAVCSHCGQTTRATIHPDFIDRPIDGDVKSFGTKCAWCRKAFYLDIKARLPRRKQSTST